MFELRSVDVWFDFMKDGDIVGSIHLKCEWYFSILPGAGAEPLRTLKGPQPTPCLKMNSTELTIVSFVESEKPADTPKE